VFFVSPPPCPSHAAQVSAAVVRPLRVAAGFHPAAETAGAAPVVAELTLSNARIPAGGGSFQFYLVDPKATSKGVAIGKLAFEGPASPQVRNLRVHVELGASALAILRDAASPSIRIVPRRPDGQPLLVQSIELHDAPQ
jgi:hypothetical protein